MIYKKDDDDEWNESLTRSFDNEKLYHHINIYKFELSNVNSPVNESYHSK